MEPTADSDGIDSIDRPISTRRQEPPGEMMARMTLQEDPNEMGLPPTNSLETQFPGPRGEFGVAPNQAASDALKSMQQQAVPASGQQEPTPFPESGEELKGDDDEFPEEEDEDEESSEISGSDEDGSWITWFCSLRGNEFFCEVDEDYIQVRYGMLTKCFVFLLGANQQVSRTIVGRFQPNGLELDGSIL